MTQYSNLPLLSQDSKLPLNVQKIEFSKMKSLQGMQTVFHSHPEFKSSVSGFYARGHCSMGSGLRIMAVFQCCLASLCIPDTHPPYT